MVVVQFGKEMKMKYLFPLGVTWREAKRTICDFWWYDEEQSYIEHDLGKVDPDALVLTCVGDAKLIGVQRKGCRGIICSCVIVFTVVFYPCDILSGYY